MSQHCSYFQINVQSNSIQYKNCPWNTIQCNVHMQSQDSQKGTKWSTRRLSPRAPSMSLMPRPGLSGSPPNGAKSSRASLGRGKVLSPHPCVYAVALGHGLALGEKKSLNRLTPTSRTLLKVHDTSPPKHPSSALTTSKSISFSCVTFGPDVPHHQNPDKTQAFLGSNKAKTPFSYTFPMVAADQRGHVFAFDFQRNRYETYFVWREGDTRGRDSNKLLSSLLLLLFLIKQTKILKPLINRFWLVARIGVSVTCITFSPLRKREIIVGLSDHSLQCWNIGTLFPHLHYLLKLGAHERIVTNKMGNQTRVNWSLNYRRFIMKSHIISRPTPSNPWSFPLANPRPSSGTPR